MIVSTMTNIATTIIRHQKLGNSASISIKAEPTIDVNVSSSSLNDDSNNNHAIN